MSLEEKETAEEEYQSRETSRENPSGKSRKTSLAILSVLVLLLPVLAWGALVGLGADKWGSIEGKLPAGSAMREIADGAERVKLTAANETQAEEAWEKEWQAAEELVAETFAALPAAEKEIVCLNGYEPSVDVLDALAACIEKTEKSGHAVGFVVVDLKTGKGVSYNTGREFYGASSIKIHRLLAIAVEEPEVITKYKSDIRAILSYSDNAAYERFYYRYGNKPFEAYIKDAGATIRFSTHIYAYYTPAALAQMWWHAYQLMQENEACAQICEWAKDPEVSPIHETLGKTYETISKAGWIGGYRVNTAADGGIVLDPESPYLIVIMSDYAGWTEPLNPYVEVFEQMHQEIKRPWEVGK